MEILPQNVASLRRLVGPFVPLPCNSGQGGKGPILLKWQKLRLHNVTARHVAQCERAEYRLGVSLGSASDGLCTLDCDCDEFGAEMLRLNPQLAKTLTTTCNRGRTYWLRITGPFPNNAPLLWRDLKVGEWRSTGNLSVIAGRDTETGNWRRFICDLPALAIPFASILWPEGLTNKGNAWPEPEDATTQDVEQRSEVVYVCSTSQSNAEKERAAKKWRLYGNLVRHLRAESGERNDLLSRAVPFVLHAVCPKLAMAFFMRHFDEAAEQSGWRATRKEHKRSVDALISGYVRDYAGKLPESDRARYAQLSSDLHRAAFRICRDCAKRNDPDRNSPPGLFVMAYGELAARLECSNATAHAVLMSFVRTGLIQVEIAGVQRVKGVIGKGTQWRWLLPVQSSAA